jgi:hypothetical protein
VRGRRAALAVALVAAACDGNGATSRIAIDLDVPGDDDEGSLLRDLESLQFRVSDGRDFVAVQLYRVEDGLPRNLTLPDVPAGDQILFDLSGLALGAEVAYGRTCRITVAENDDEVSALLYFSRVGRFRAGDPPLEPERRAGLMFADDRGRAIVAGGVREGGTQVELFDPRVGQFSEAGRAVARVAGAIAVRTDGTAVLAGGVAEDGGALVGAVEEIVPPLEEDRIRQIGPDRQVEAVRIGLALAALPDRSILLSGGRIDSGVISDGVALLADGDDEFRPVATLAQARAGHTASVGLGGVAYLIGGLAPDATAATEVATGSIELYRPQDQTMRTLGAALEAPRFGHSATVLADGRILIVGGKVPRTVPCEPDVGPELCVTAVSAVELFDPIVGEVRTIDEEITGGIYDHTATPVAGGRVLIAGGFDSEGVARADAWLFDPQVEALVPTRELVHARAGHTATELCDGTVLLVGGVAEDEQPPPSERYSPAASRLP